MILTPVDSDSLPQTLAAFAGALGDGEARRVFAMIANPENVARAEEPAAEAHRHAALRLAGEFGMATRPGSPAQDFSWSGSWLRSGTEAYVLLHEVAHYQLAAPSRRPVIDFGLGAGPETGDRAAADRAARLAGLARETEEAMASLLGIMWEVTLGQPALASFLDQNWLEGSGRPGTAAHFETILRRLRRGGFIDAEMRPTRHLRSEPDRST